MDQKVQHFFRTQPKNIMFSIVIPVFNLEDYVSSVLESIHAQQYADYEVIIIDDGSTDRTSLICNEWCKKHSRFQLINQANGGVSSARNRGIDAASGDYVWFVDGDDWIVPNALELLHECLCEHQYDFVGFNWFKTNKPYSCDCVNPLAKELVKRSIHNVNEDYYFSCAPFSASRLCIKRSLLLEGSHPVRFQRMKVYEDTLFALTVLSRSKSYILLDAALYHYYQRPTSSLHNLDVSALEDFLLFSASTLKLGETCPKGKGYFSFFVRQVSLLGAMSLVVKNSPTKQQKRQNFTKLCNAVKEWRRYGFPPDLSLRIVIRTQSYTLWYFLLYLRYIPRRFMGKHPGLCSLYRKIKAVFWK